MAINELPTFYYHDNFLHLIRHVHKLYDDLLDDAEREFIEQFLLLSPAAQQIYIRLLCRKGDLFRFRKLSYAEIPDITSALRELAKQRFIGWLHSGREYEHETHEVLSLFTKPELIQWALSLGDGFQKAQLTKLPRDELSALLKQHVEQSPERLSSLIHDDVLCLFGELEFTTIKLLYFGNLHQDFTDFVLRDLGIYRFENYVIDTESRGFQSRQQLDEQLNYYHFFDGLPVLKEATEQQLFESIDSLLVLRGNSNDERVIRRLNRQGCELTRQLERLGETTQALALYRRFPLHPARERRCRMLWQQLRKSQENKVFPVASELVDVITAMHSSPYHVLEKQFVAGFLPQVVKRFQQLLLNDLASQCERLILPLNQWPESDLTISKGEVWQQHGVEAAVIAELQQGHQPPSNQQHNHQHQYDQQRLHDYRYQAGIACHFENALILSVFGLFYWPVIFAPVSGAFYHDFHHAPVDLYETDFLKKRWEIYQQLNAVFDHDENQDQFKTQVLERAAHKLGVSNPFIYWGIFTEENQTVIEQALEQIPLKHWRLLFDYLWMDIKNHRNGLPDLLWLADSRKCGDYELIEVKGPGDSLQKNQKGWLEYFVQQSIPARVLYIHELADD